MSEVIAARKPGWRLVTRNSLRRARTSITASSLTSASYAAPVSPLLGRQPQASVHHADLTGYARRPGDEGPGEDTYRDVFSVPRSSWGARSMRLVRRPLRERRWVARLVLRATPSSLRRTGPSTARTAASTGSAPGRDRPSTQAPPTTIPPPTRPPTVPRPHLLYVRGRCSTFPPTGTFRR